MVAIAAMLLVSVQATASAAASPPVLRGVYGAILTVNGTVVSTTSTSIAVPDGAGPQGATIYCDRMASYSDHDGNYTIQHQCGGSTAPWGYVISPAVCSLVSGSVYEAGMMWARNGVTQGTQAFHNGRVGINCTATTTPRMTTTTSPTPT
ncbi:MAG TPA: hypothetical protein VHO01_00305 [Jatrophihabitans sp.]|nr:hypothetical protein [Jatrophihabitans sp.]